MEIQVGELIKKAKVSRCGNGDYPVLSMTMHDGLMFQNDRFKKQIASVDQSNYQVVKRHQLVESFPIDEGVLAVQELTEEGIVSPAYKIWDVNMNRVIPVYLELALRSPRSIEYYKSKLRGTTARRRSITDGEFCAMQIKLPDLKEQERIIGLISRTRAISAKRQQELDTLDDLIKARFVEMFGDPVQNPFGWEKKRFDEICENLDSRRKPITSSDRVEGIYPYYGASGIVDYVEDYIFDEDILLVSEDGANLLMRSTPIAFSVSGKVWVNNHAHVVRFGKMCLQKYIEIFFSLIDISDSITGSAQPKLNQAKLNAMEFPIPDERRLEEYLSFLKQVDKSKVVA